MSLRVHNDEVTFSFDDNGAGIPEERRQDAIRPFIRLEESRNRRTGGAGLGLSITSDIVLSHGGELHWGLITWRSAGDNQVTNLAKNATKRPVTLAFQYSLPPFGTSCDGCINTTSPSAPGTPSVNTSDINGPICRGGKFTTAITCAPIKASHSYCAVICADDLRMPFHRQNLYLI